MVAALSAVAGKTNRNGQKRKMAAGSGIRTAAGVIRLGHVVGAAITNRRELGPAEGVIMVWGAALLLTFSGIEQFPSESVLMEQTEIDGRVRVEHGRQKQTRF
jgi:hypothetical protein